MSAEKTKRLLAEYGQAIRGDWGSIDGRQVQGDLATIAYSIDTYGDEPSRGERMGLCLCTEGRGHWSGWCDEKCKTGGTE
ncbi:hypothetical protein [Glaciibacter psychrotolerans]|uniref:Uncharacterized protein n=1 Tax=Glaciibacter psychrotolerans TaxID=670054 RepID=A0A7Z0ECQ0_9MICO|nr:hypothetical protein [Leifsonia psychrotolerans]NYJ19185.1 hypothetical protein [Leifsonia psychrotolerans]